MNLAELFEKAHIEDIPEWAHGVNIVHPYFGTPLEPRPAQVRGLNLALNSDNGRFGLFDDLGSGKSFTSYAYLLAMVSAGNKCLVIMPPRLLEQYERNLHAMFPGLPVSSGIYYGPPKVREGIAGKWHTEGQPDIIITGFEQFRTEVGLFQYLLPTDVIVGDEVRWLANPENTVSAALRVYMGEVGEKAALMMNGTPARTNLANLYGFIKFCSPDAYHSREQFNRKHIKFETHRIGVTSRNKTTGAITKKDRKVHKIVGYKNTQELYRNLYKRGRRVVLEDTGTLIVPKEFSLSPEHKKMYKKMVSERLIIFDDDTLLDLTEANSVRHQAMRSVTQTSMFQLKDPSEVIVTLHEMLDEIDFDETKVVLGAYYQDTVELLQRELSAYNPATLYGKVSGTKAEKEKQRFLTDPSCRVIILNYESGGVGVDGLQNVSNIGISVEPTHIPGDFQQWVRRLDRPGQKRAVKIFCMMPTGTIYSKVIRARVQAAESIHLVVNRNQPVSVAELRKELLDM